MQGQLKAHPRQARRSSRNMTPPAGTSNSKPTVMFGQSLSPAKKLAKLMRERPLNELPNNSSVGGSKTPGRNNSNAEKKQDSRKTSKSDRKSPSLGKKSKIAMKPTKLSSSKHGVGTSAGEAGVASAVAEKGNSRTAPGKDNATTLKPRKDATSLSTSAKKRSKHEHGSVDGKRPKRSEVANAYHSPDKKRRQSEHGSPTSSPTKKHHSKKPRDKIRRDARQSAPDSAAGSDIAALLRLGEGAAEDVPMSDDSDWEAVDTHSSDLVTKGFVEVTLPSDVAMQKKKKKKGFDVEAYMKRQLSRVRREIQQLLHKTHLLCLLSRALQLNALLNSETPLACAMSMLPSKYAYPPKRVSLSYVEKFLKWFREKVPLEAPVEGVTPSEDVFRALEARLRAKRVYSPLELVCLFVLILRAIGVDCRLICSLQPVPLKPPSPPAAATAGKTANLAAAKSGKASSKSKLPSGSKQNKRKESKPSDTGKKSVSAAGRSKAKRDVSAPPVRTGSDRKAKQRASTSAQQADSSDDSSGDEFEPRRPDRRVVSSPSGSEGTSGGAGRPSRSATDFWAEVYVEEELRWISVDVVGGGVHCVTQIRKRATAPLTYVLGCDNAGRVKDLTARYDPKWHSSTRKLRVEPDWWAEATGAWRPTPTRRDREEDEELLRDLQERPMPQSIVEFKDHPLYALERHLLKFQAIYPPSAVPLGYVGKGERRTPVYARECVRTLHARETWIKQARVVKEGEKPYKIVKARPKWDKLLQKVITDKPLEVFGRWQTAEYVPPRATGGKVPRNDYGNVELFKPSMLPGGTVHLNVEGLSRVAKRLGIDCAPAMVGWDYHCGGSHPVFEGYVVCEEFEDTLMDAWEADQREARKRQREKREKRILDNWRRLVRGVLIRQRLARKYDFQDQQTGSKRPATSDRPGASKKARTPVTAGKHDPKTEAKAELSTLMPNLEPKVKLEPGQGRGRGTKANSEPKPAAKLSAKLKAAKAEKTPKQEPKEENEEDEEVPETQEEVARRVEASMASMGLRRVALSSDSEADSDAEGTGAKQGTKAGNGTGFGAAVMAKLSPAGSLKSPTSVPTQRKRRSAPAVRGRGRKASPASRSPSLDLPEAGAGAAGRASRRRSGRAAAVDYREAAGSGSEGEAPLREDDLTSDEEQPFVKAAAASSDDDDDFMGF